jgi:hypothetical protein
MPKPRQGTSGNTGRENPGFYFSGVLLRFFARVTGTG